MDRQQRRDLKHDKFVDEVGTWSARAKENQRLLLTITGVAVAVAVLAYGIYFYRSNHEEKAQLALGQAMDTIESPLLPAPGTQPQPGSKYKTEAERSAAAEKQLKAVESGYGGTDAADLASLYLARIASARGDLARGPTRLGKYIQDNSQTVLLARARSRLFKLRI